VHDENARAMRLEAGRADVAVNLISPALLAPLEGAGLSIAADPLGGLGPFTISWTGLPDGCAPTSGPTIACNPSAPGTFHLRVVATDSLGGIASNASTVTVAASLIGLPLTEGVELIGGAAALAAVVTGVALYYGLRARGSRRRPTKPEGGTAATGTPKAPPEPSSRTAPGPRAP